MPKVIFFNSREWLMNNSGCPVCKLPIDSDKSANSKRLKQLQSEEKAEGNKDNINFNGPKIPEYNKINCYKQIVKFKEMLVKGI
jgi:hypothetical protein